MKHVSKDRLVAILSFMDEKGHNRSPFAMRLRVELTKRALKERKKGEW